MKVLITGGAGFIGTFTKELLVKEGHDVIIVDNLITGSMTNISQDDIFIHEDIRNEALHDKLDCFKIDAIIHLAAQTSVPQSIDDPLFDMSENIEGTIKMLQLAKKLGVKTFIFASSAAVYGDNERCPLTEDERLVPSSPYGISKMCGENYVKFFCEMNDINYVILRYANVYGPKQTNDGEGGVIKVFFDKIAKGETPVIFGDGNQTRDFIYVEDVARAHLFALQSSKSGIYNVSTNVETTINDLVYFIAKEFGERISPTYKNARPGDIYRSCLDNKKIISSFGWEPIYTVEDGISKTYEIITSNAKESK
ncbi:NAD-dependent epimerase/dehydratase family protein [Anoxybacillus gonensis]|uniref:NAD-dependent epimerase/dehydratase family protein n=1 Tax=Anoxybacillus gonensis TaxID=198467 RepID=UPI0002BE825F|nr:NAD-dependent epimerase/dehydratase family protein [Anoxybacillus gonensis]EMI09529.1 NAD-dependent epimerase/dehydratase [Anoxybacillus gonensis]